MHVTKEINWKKLDTNKLVMENSKSLLDTFKN